jgi:hypothetical protein
MGNYGPTSLSFGRINSKIELNMKSYTVPPHDPPRPLSKRKSLTKDKLLNNSLKIGKPWFFQLWRLYTDSRDCVLWDTEVPRAAVAPDEAPKVKVVHGPSRSLGQQHLPPERGTYWGVGDRRNGKSLRELRQRNDDPPPPYSER